MIKVLFYIFGIVIITGLIPNLAKAVLPPDIIINASVQIGQFFAVISLFFATIFGTVFHWQRFKIFFNRYKFVIIIALFLGIFVSYFTFFYKYSFYSDKLVIIINDDSTNNANIKNDIFTIELYREEIFPHIYSNYYLLHGFNKDEPNEPYYNIKSFISFNKNASPKYFINKIKNENLYNIQQENYALGFNTGKDAYKLNLTDLKGDFIINNDLSRLVYLNMGKSKIEINGEIYPIDFMLIKTMSNNKKYAISSDENLHLKTNHMFITDENGSQYVIDDTKVEKVIDGYNSHNWIVCKEKESQQKNINNKTVQYLNDRILTIDDVCFGKSINITNPKITTKLIESNEVITGFVQDKDNKYNFIGLNLYVEY
jgi:hypothetical protein